MIKKSLLVVALMGLLSTSAFAYDGVIKFKGGCQASNTGSCKIEVSGIDGAAKIYSASEQNGQYGAVTKEFTAPATKRIPNSVNNVCFYARKVGATTRTKKICLNK